MSCPDPRELQTVYRVYLIYVLRVSDLNLVSAIPAKIISSFSQIGSSIAARVKPQTYKHPSKQGRKIASIQREHGSRS